MKLDYASDDPRLRYLLRTYAMLSGINQLIVRERGQQALLQSACSIAVDKGGFRMAWIGLLDAARATVQPVASAGVVTGYLDAIGIDVHEPVRRRGPIATAVRTGAPQVVNDLAADPDFAPWKSAAAARGYRACGAFPLVVQERVIGTFNLYAAEAGFFDEEECRLLAELADDIAFALDVIQREAEARDTESRVARQRATLIELARQGPDEDLPVSLRRIAEAAADTLDVARVSIWTSVDGGSTLVSAELYDRETRRHSAGQRIDAVPYELSFDGFEGLEVLAADDALTDPRTRSYAAEYLVPFGITSVLAAPIQIEGQRNGIFTLEHTGRTRTWRSDEKTFAVAMASLVSLSLESAQRREAERVVVDRTERFRELADTIEDVFWIAEPDNINITYVSPGFERIWGRPASQLASAPGSWLESIHPDDRGRVEAAAMGIAVTGLYRELYRIVRPDGALRWISDHGVPVRDENGRILRVVGIARDITERRQLEEQYLQSQKMEAIGQLAGGIAHDFNNILAIIIMQAEQTARSAVGEEAREGLTQIRAAAERAANLTRQLLLFSRRQVMQLRELDMNEAVTNVARLVERIIGADVRLELDLYRAPLFARADAGMLDQVLLNLVVNARDAMPAGGRLRIQTLKVRGAGHTAGGQTGSTVCLRISDTGHGIPAHVLPHIFEPFFTTKEHGKGTGLGLATAFGIIKQHDGWIDVSSRTNEGTTFSIFLPLAREPGADASEDARPADNPPGKETILLAEDDASVRALIRATLARYGYRVLEASAGSAAVDLWSTHADQIDLLLTDLVMSGGMSGRELASRLHQDNPALRVLFTSGYSADIAGRELSLRPGENFLQKPFAASQLLSAVRQSLDPH